MTPSRTISIAAALILPLGLSVASAKAPAVVSAKTVTRLDLSTSPIVEDEEDEMDQIAECLDSDTKADCVNCCLEEFVDDGGLFTVCVEECNDACDDSDTCADSEDECTVDLSTEIAAKPSANAGIPVARAITATSSDSKASGGGLESDDPVECLDSDTLSECVNCCVEEFVDDADMLYMCVEDCADSCPS